MVVVSNNVTASDDTQSSPSVDIGTVTGIIVGAICLFGLIISYQLLSTRWRFSESARRRRGVIPSPALTPAGPAQSRWRVWWARRTACVKSSRVRLHSSLVDAKTNSTARKSNPLRSLILPSLSHRDHEHTRRTFASHFRINFYPSPPSDPFPPPPPRRNYTPLDDSKYTERSDGARHTEKPAAAVVSPWSPSEDQYPYSTTPTPLTRRWQDAELLTPPPFSPPPAYVPNTPLRGGFAPPHYSPAPLGRPAPQEAGTALPRAHEPADEVDLTDVVVVDRTDSAQGVFVIGDELDSTDSDSASLSSNLSL